MEKISKFLLSIYSFTFIFTLLSSPIHAIEEERNERIETRCEIVTARVDLITSRYEENKERHIERYKNIADKVANLITKLEESGYNVTALKEDLKQLVDLKSEFITNYTNAIQHLNNSKTYACGNSEGDFKNEIILAKEDLLASRETSLKIRLFILNEIRPDIEDIRDQIAD